MSRISAACGRHDNLQCAARRPSGPPSPPLHQLGANLEKEIRLLAGEKNREQKSWQSRRRPGYGAARGKEGSLSNNWIIKIRVVPKGSRKKEHLGSVVEANFLMDLFLAGFSFLDAGRRGTRFL